ncbi:MAG: ABC transporter ATP-binding protein, partial [Oscillospiraceae bacterium]
RCKMKKSSVAACIKALILKKPLQGIFLLLVLLLGVLASLAPPQIMRLIIDDYLLKNNGARLFIPALIYLSVVVLSGVLDFLKGLLLTVLGQNTIFGVRRAMMQKLRRLPSSFFTENAPGGISSRLTTDVDNMSVLFSDGLVSMAADCLKLLGIVVSIWMFSFSLGIISLLLIPLVFAVTRFFRKRMLAAQTKNLEQLGCVNAHIADSVKNISMLKLFSKESYMEEKYCKELSRNYETNGRVILYDACYAPIIRLIRALVIALVVLLSAEQIGAIGISVGMVAATIELISSLLDPIEALGMEIQNIQKGLSGVKRIDEFLGLSEEQKDDTITSSAVIEGCKNGAVVFENLSFSYNSEVQVLKNLNAEIARGEGVAFTGRTGVGKTTLFSLVMGLLSPSDGRVLIGGFDADKIPNREKRAIFGYVEQSFRFVPGSIAAQISLGDPEISRERIEEVCSEVGLSESIEALPNGYDTDAEGGAAFSFGQCQLLSIARATAARPPILLLDEMTAGLDALTEEHVMKALQNATKNRTVLSISHRSSAINSSDRVIFIENGEIVDRA